MTFFGRLILVICVSLSATILAVAGTAFFVGEKVGEEIELARVSHLLGTLEQTTEANLAIGLSLDEISSLQPMIEREKADDAGIVVIDIFNAAGISVHSTDRGSIGEQVESAWKTHLGHDGIWHGRLRGEAVVSTPAAVISLPQRAAVSLRAFFAPIGSLLIIGLIGFVMGVQQPANADDSLLDGLVHGQEIVISGDQPLTGGL